MISKNKIKYIHSLNLKKNRDAQDVFVAEGSKIVGDILARGDAEGREMRDCGGIVRRAG